MATHYPPGMTETAVSDEFVPCPRHGTRCYPELHNDLPRRIEVAIGLSDRGIDGVSELRDRILAIIEDHDAETRQPTERAATGQCEDCSCCIASGCHPGPDSTCPTDRLGHSVCPCTED